MTFSVRPGTFWCATAINRSLSRSARCFANGGPEATIVGSWPKGEVEGAGNLNQPANCTKRSRTCAARLVR